MSMLARYKRPGGFLQLLSLIETFGPQKKDKFLEMIELEDGSWAKALREKLLTVERLMSWPDEAVAEVFKNLQPKTIACTIKGLGETDAGRVLQFFSHAERRRLEDEMALNIKPEEISATFVKVVEHTRKMVSEGRIRVGKFDGALVIPENFEEHLANGLRAAPDAKKDAEEERRAKRAAEIKMTNDIPELQRRVLLLIREVETLKEENQALKARLAGVGKAS